MTCYIHTYSSLKYLGKFDPEAFFSSSGLFDYLCLPGQRFKVEFYVFLFLTFCGHSYGFLLFLYPWSKNRD